LPPDAAESDADTTIQEDCLSLFRQQIYYGAAKKIHAEAIYGKRVFGPEAKTFPRRMRRPPYRKAFPPCG
jgi:hypothetical protein